MLFSLQKKSQVYILCTVFALFSNNFSCMCMCVRFWEKGGGERQPYVWKGRGPIVQQVIYKMQFPPILYLSIDLSIYIYRCIIIFIAMHACQGNQNCYYYYHNNYYYYYLVIPCVCCSCHFSSLLLLMLFLVCFLFVLVCCCWGGGGKEDGLCHLVLLLSNCHLELLSFVVCLFVCHHQLLLLFVVCCLLWIKCDLVLWWVVC